MEFLNDFELASKIIPAVVVALGLTKKGVVVNLREIMHVDKASPFKSLLHLGTSEKEDDC
jgi:hypothetical protein